MRRKSGYLNVRFINRRFFPNDLKNIAEINEGRCFLWAYIAASLYEDVELWDMGAHAFVRSKKTGKFYDSEVPKGSEDWRDLRATNFGRGCGCNICTRPARPYRKIARFKHSWKRMAKQYSIDWEKVDQQIAKVLSCHQTTKQSQVA